DRNEREPALRRLADQALDLRALQQELPHPLRIVAALLPLLVRRDVQVLEPHLAVADSRERLRERGPARAEGLHLRTGQDDAGLQPLEDLVVEAGAAIRRDGLLALLARAHRDRLRRR